MIVKIEMIIVMMIMIIIARIVTILHIIAACIDIHIHPIHMCADLYSSYVFLKFGRPALNKAPRRGSGPHHDRILKFFIQAAIGISHDRSDF